LGLYDLAHFEAALSRHNEIEENEIRIMLLQQLERFLSVAGGGYPIALFLQDHSDEIDYVSFG